jgi:hypothetical protein
VTGSDGCERCHCDGVQDLGPPIAQCPAMPRCRNPCWRETGSDGCDMCMCPRNG